MSFLFKSKAKNPVDLVKSTKDWCLKLDSGDRKKVCDYFAVFQLNKDFDVIYVKIWRNIVQYSKEKKRIWVIDFSRYRFDYNDWKLGQ